MNQTEAKKIKFDINQNERFTPVFRKLWHEAGQHRFVLAYGGSGTGKSHAVAQLLILQSMLEVKSTVVGRKVADTHNLSTIKLITAILEGWGFLGNLVIYKKSNHEFVFGNGSTINFVGMDKIEKLKSIHGVKTFWFEEMTEGTKEDFEEINRRLRGIPGIQLFGTFNPVDIDSWVKTFFWDNEHFSNPDLTIKIHTDYKENHFLTDYDISELEAMKAYNENDYRIYTLGQWGQLRTGNEFYFKFSLKDHVRGVPYDPTLSLNVSFDFNVVPYICASFWQVKDTNGKYEVRCVDEITLKTPKNNTFDLCAAILERYGSHKGGINIYGDATGRARKTSSKEHDWQIVTRMLQSMLNNQSDRVPSANPSQRARRDFINHILADKLPMRIVINQGCKLMIEDLTRVKETADGHKLKVATKEGGISFERWGHLSDSMDYILCEMFKNLFTKY